MQTSFSGDVSSPKALSTYKQAIFRQLSHLFQTLLAFWQMQNICNAEKLKKNIVYCILSIVYIVQRLLYHLFPLQHVQKTNQAFPASRSVVPWYIEQVHLSHPDCYHYPDRLLKQSSNQVIQLSIS